MSSFTDVTRLAPLGDRRYHVRGEPSWMQGRGLSGGLVAALFVRALEAEAPRGQHVARLTVAFTAPFAPTPAEITVRVVRGGRNVSCLAAELRNDGVEVPAASCLATLALPRTSATLAHATLRPPEVPRPDDVADGPEELYLPTFTSHFEFRQCLGPRPFSGGAEARVGGWCRARANVPRDAALLAALLDAWSPAAVGVAPGWCPVASLEMTVHFLVPPSELAASLAREWLLFDARCDHVEAGLADERAALFDANGRALATAQQLVALLPGADRT